MELEASARLFGGRAALRARVPPRRANSGRRRWPGRPTGWPRWPWRAPASPTRAPARWLDALDALPLHTLSAARPHARTLGQTGCRTLGDLRRLPRGALGRRFDQALLHALDRLYGHAPEAHDWLAVPEVFEARLELHSRVDEAAALVFGARRLLLQLAGWLFARRSGVVAFTLRWAHDAMRSREVGGGRAHRAHRRAHARRRAPHAAAGRAPGPRDAAGAGGRTLAARHRGAAPGGAQRQPAARRHTGRAGESPARCWSACRRGWGASAGAAPCAAGRPPARGHVPLAARRCGPAAPPAPADRYPAAGFSAAAAAAPGHARRTARCTWASCACCWGRSASKAAGGTATRMLAATATWCATTGWRSRPRPVCCGCSRPGWSRRLPGSCTAISPDHGQPPCAASRLPP
jgi:hypothetical protein